MIISGVKILSVDEKIGNIPLGYVVIEDGKIKEVCAGEVDPSMYPDEEIVHEDGCLFPGLIDAHTHLGIIEDSLDFEGDDCNEASDPCTPHLRACDGINLDRAFAESLAAGVTTVAVAPGSSNPIGGQVCVLKTHGKCVDNMLVCAPAALKCALGENPKGSFHGQNQMPETRMATAAIIRDTLRRAREYYDDLTEYLKGKDDPESDAEKPDFDARLDALVPLFRDRMPIHFHAHRADDIFTAIRIAKEFGLAYRIVHGTEGHLIADELAEADAMVFCGPTLSDRSKPELANLTFATPGILDRAGVCVSITTDHPVTPLKYLTVCAALAVKEGMSVDATYRAITLNPAKMLSLSDKLGSLTPGKDADLVLFDGDPLSLTTSVKRVYINGRCVYAPNASR